MPVTISWQTIVSFAAVLGAGAVVWNYITRVVHKLEYDREQDERIARLEEAHSRDISDLRRHHDEDMAATRKEMAIICRGILASLKDDEMAKQSSIKEMEDCFAFSSSFNDAKIPLHIIAISFRVAAISSS